MANLVAPVSQPDGASPRRTVLIVDDHRMFAESLARSLAADHDVVGLAHSAAEALRLMEQRQPECVLLDLQLPDGDGLALILHLRRLRGDVRIVIVTMHSHWSIAQASLAGGANGFVPKEAPTTEVTRAIRETTSGGETFVSRFASPHFDSASPRTARRIGDRLTPRQHEILRLIGDGKNGVQISASLGIAESTVTFHRKNIMRAFGMRAEAELLRFAVLAAEVTGNMDARTERKLPPEDAHDEAVD